MEELSCSNLRPVRLTGPTRVIYDEKPDYRRPLLGSAGRIWTDVISDTEFAFSEAELQVTIQPYDVIWMRPHE